MRISNEFEFTINMGQGKENPVLILREPTEEEIIEFLKNRIIRIGKEVVDQTVKAKCEIVDKLLMSCRKIEINVEGRWSFLSPKTPNWKSKIPVNWKTSVGNQFEEREVYTESDEKK